MLRQSRSAEIRYGMRGSGVFFVQIFHFSRVTLLRTQTGWGVHCGTPDAGVSTLVGSDQGVSCRAII